MSKTLAQLPDNSLLFPTTHLSNTVTVLKTFRSGFLGALYNSNIGNFTVTLTVKRSEKEYLNSCQANTNTQLRR